MKRNSLKLQIRKHPLISTLIITGVSCSFLIVGLGSAPAITSAGGPVSHLVGFFGIKGESVTATDSTDQRPTYAETPSYVSPSSSPSSAPEPASLMLMAPALVLLARRSRKA